MEIKLSQGRGWNHKHKYTFNKVGLWENWAFIYYKGGEIRPIEKQETIKKLTEIMQTYLDHVKEEGESRGIQLYYEEFYDDLNEFYSQLNLIREQLETATRMRKYQEFSMIKSKIYSLKKKFELSEVMFNYSRQRDHYNHDRIIHEERHSLDEINCK